MTERLYEARPVRTEQDARFTARIVRAERRGERTAVVLDRTLFYPAGGGQPCDRGRLGREHVVDVIEEGHDVVHLVEGEGELAAGAEVEGRLDVARRLDHAAHHSGQHLLSGVLLRRFGAATVSFHLGAEVATIDLARPSLEPGLLRQAEAEVNAAVRACAPVTTTVLHGDEARAAASGLRKPPAAEALADPRGLRIVQLGTDDALLDRESCCGTHVGSTGEIGLVVLLGTEKGKKGETRLSFVCGARAVAAVRSRLDALAAASGAISAGFAELPRRVEQLVLDAKAAWKELSAARAALLTREGEALARAATGRVVSHLLPAGEAGDARTLAQAIVQARPELRAAVAVRAGDDAALAVAAGEASGGDAGAALKAALAAHGGKGGGSARLAQGAVKGGASPADLLAAAAAALA